MKSEYICQHPELSRLDAYVSYRKLQEKRNFLSIIPLSIFGVGLTCITVYHPELLTVKIVSLLLLILSVLLLLPFTVKKWTFKPIDYVAQLMFLIGSIVNSIALYSLVPSIFLSGRILLIVSGCMMIAFSILYLITGFKSVYVRKRKLSLIYEYNSDKTHTGIIIPHNTKRVYDCSGMDALYLAELLVLNKTEPFRIYFCDTMLEAVQVIANPEICNLWIFGHGSKGGVALTDGVLYYDTLLDKNIEKKGYIHQFHCNGHQDEHDEISLVSILVDEENKHKSTDTGLQIKLFWIMCKIPIPYIQKIGKKRYNIRSAPQNKEEIKRYIKENS